MNKKRALQLFTCTTLAIGATAYGMDQKSEPQKTFCAEITDALFTGNEELVIAHAKQKEKIEYSDLSCALLLPTFEVATILVQKIKENKQENLNEALPLVTKNLLLHYCVTTHGNIATFASRHIVATLSFMLDNGFDVNGQDCEKRTALSYVAQYDLAQAAQLLIDHGAWVDRADERGQSPLEWATAGWNDQYPTHAFNVLINAGAEIVRGKKHSILNSALVLNHAYICAPTMSPKPFAIILEKHINPRLAEHQKILNCVDRQYGHGLTSIGHIAELIVDIRNVSAKDGHVTWTEQQKLKNLHTIAMLLLRTGARAWAPVCDKIGQCSTCLAEQKMCEKCKKRQEICKEIAQLKKEYEESLKTQKVAAEPVADNAAFAD